MPERIVKFAIALTMACSIIALFECASEAGSTEVSSNLLSADSNQIEDEDLVFLAHGVAHHFYLARLDFEEKRFKEAADEIRTGTSIMKVEALRVSGGEEQNIQRSIADLEKLADDVESGAVTSVDELENSFAGAQILLANHYQQKASRAIERKDYKAAANAHEAAARHLESEHPLQHPLSFTRKVSNPEESFHSAREAFLKKDLKTASDEIEDGVAQLKEEAERAPKEENLALSTSIEELEMLARDTGNGKITSVDELDEAFRNAHLALAQTYHEQALEAMNRKDYQTAFEIHKAAAIQFRYLYIVRGHEGKLPDADQ